MTRTLETMLDELRKPFHPSQVTWKPGAVKGERALALAYADLRAYMNRLDEVCGDEWAVSYDPWGDDRIICKLNIGGVTRSSTGESSAEAERGEIGGTVAEAQAFKRASAMFGLGRYLYNLPSGWYDFDPAKRQFTEGAKAKLTGMLVQHYRRATEDKSEAAAQPPIQDAPRTPQKAATPVNGTNGHSDNPFDDSAPTDEEHDILSMWQSPEDAKVWAINVGACENSHEARNSFKKIVDAHGGKLTEKNIAQVYLEFVRRQNEKLQAQQPVTA